MLFVCLVLLTCAGQGGNMGISDAVKQEITQGLLERHGADKGVAIAASCRFFDFETCEEIDIRGQNVRCVWVLCMTRAVYSVAHLSSTSPPPHEPHTTRCNSWRTTTFSRCAQASADSSA